MDGCQHENRRFTVPGHDRKEPCVNYWADRKGRCVHCGVKEAEHPKPESLAAEECAT